MNLRTQLAVVALEHRNTPATVTLNHGVLTIVGTNAGDYVEVATPWYTTIEVRQTVDGALQSKAFDATAVQRIVFRGRAGDDTFQNNTNRPSRAYGDAGNDALFGGSGKDLLVGGAGDDERMFGNGGSDTLIGGSGTDKLDGGSGNDRLSGDDGNDTLFGGFNDDVIFGGRGTDFLFGEAGEDTLFGGLGDDTLSGVRDGLIDQLYGQAGRDTFIQYSLGIPSEPEATEIEADRDFRRGVDVHLIIE